MKRITRNELKKYAENYINFESGEYFIAPQAYSPLYRQLYEALIKREEPYLPVDFDMADHEKDFHECNTPFDRYLVAIFDSRFELSHPLPIPDKDATKEKLVQYLNLKYGKATTDTDSFNYNREKKQLLDLFPQSLRVRFEEQFETTCRSSWYKLFTFNYKLSKLNTQWKVLIRRARSLQGAQTLLDNVVKFNDIDSQKSQENSSLFMTLFYELDQGRPDGNANNSRLIIMLPTALELLEKAIRRQAINLWNDALDGEEIKEDITEKFKYRSRECSSLLEQLEPCYATYNDVNHDFYDTLTTVILKNDYHNKVMAKLSFEQNLIDDPVWHSALHLLFPHSRWIQVKLSPDEQICKVAQILSIEPDKIDSDILKISEIVNKLLKVKLDNINEHTLSNVSLFIVSAIKYSMPSKIKGSLKGAKEQFYHLYNRLYDSVQRAEEKKLQSWQIETVFRPSLVHFLQYCYELLIWSENGTVNNLSKFIKLREITYQSTLNISNQLESTHHYLLLNICNHLISGHIGIDTVEKQFWEGQDPSGPLLAEHLQRTKYTWP